MQDDGTSEDGTVDKPKAVEKASERQERLGIEFDKRLRVVIAAMRKLPSKRRT